MPFRRLLITSLVVLIGACSSSPVIPLADRSLAPITVAQGAAVPEHDIQWGGIVIATRNLNKASEVEILAFPLDDQGRPDTSAASIGRFIASQAKYLEGKEYAAGRLVTATGRFTEVRSGQVGDADYQFPVLICNQLEIWPDESESKAKPSIHFGFGASSGGRGYGGIGIGIGF